MFVKLAFRNAKRSFQDYIIYILTLVLCVGLFYSFLSISSVYYRNSIPVEYDFETLKLCLTIPVIFITFILVFLVKYVNDFMMKRKQKEFALQTLMGMEQRTTARIFLYETLFMGGISLVGGILLGTLLSQFITSIIMSSFDVPYQIYFSLFPDTCLETVIVFVLTFLLIGLGNVRAISKMKIIDMLNADKQLDNDLKKNHLTPLITLIAVVISGLAIRLGAQTYMTLKDKMEQFTFGQKTLVFVNIALPAIFIALWAGCILYYLLRRKKGMMKRQLLLLMVPAVCMVVTSLQTVGMAVPISNSTKNYYFAVAFFYLMFLMFAFFYSLAELIRIYRSRSVKSKYRAQRLFVLGQISGGLSSATRILPFLSATLMLAITVFMLEPVLSGWTIGYLEKRAVYDLQVQSHWEGTLSDTRELPIYDETIIHEALADQPVTIKEECLVQEYYPCAVEDVVLNTKHPFAIALSDYNHLREMAGYEPVSLNEDEFTLQFHHLTTKQQIQDFTEETTTLSLGGGKTLSLKENENYRTPLGEFLYNYFGTSNFCYILPDQVCEDLQKGNIKYYANFEEKLTIDEAVQIESKLDDFFTSGEQEHPWKLDFRMKTIQRNTGMTSALAMKMLLYYGGIVLLIISFTILSLQQSKDAFDYKKRFEVIRKLGMDKTEINAIIVKQMAVWFLLPVFFAVVSSVIFFNFYLNSFRDYLDIYIGISNLMHSIAATFLILLLLFLCYFVGTWFVFSKHLYSVTRS